VPLFLAMGAVGEGWRRSPAVRALGAVVVVTLLLSLGPYLPGYRPWSLLPGFSFFRAPARWVLASSLGLSCLAAIGFDRFAAWLRPSRAVVRFALLGIASTTVVVLLVELAVAGAGGPTDRLYAGAFAALPWKESSA